MTWFDILKAKWIDYNNPIQENPEAIASDLRELLSKPPSFHASVNNFIPDFELFSLKDKARKGKYEELAQQLRDIMGNIKQMIKDYE